MQDFYTEGILVQKWYKKVICNERKEGCPSPSGTLQQCLTGLVLETEGVFQGKPQIWERPLPSFYPVTTPKRYVLHIIVCNRQGWSSPDLTLTPRFRLFFQVALGLNLD